MHFKCHIHAIYASNFMCRYQTNTTHCNQHCHHKHQYTYNSDYWQMPLYIYACHIKHVCPTALVI